VVHEEVKPQEGADDSEQAKPEIAVREDRTSPAGGTSEPVFDPCSERRGLRRHKATE
jgi:hypothetical protein